MKRLIKVGYKTVAAMLFIIAAVGVGQIIINIPISKDINIEIMAWSCDKTTEQIEDIPVKIQGKWETRISGTKFNGTIIIDDLELEQMIWPLVETENQYKGFFDYVELTNNDNDTKTYGHFEATKYFEYFTFDLTDEELIVISEVRE